MKIHSVRIGHFPSGPSARDYPRHEERDGKPRRTVELQNRGNHQRRWNDKTGHAPKGLIERFRLGAGCARSKWTGENARQTKQTIAGGIQSRSQGRNHSNAPFV